MVTLEHINSLKDYFDSAKSVAIILGPDLSPEQYVAASALYYGIEGSEKSVGIYAPRFPKGDFKAKEILQPELGKENLVIELPYIPESIDKVISHIGEESKKFYLTVKPQKGKKPIERSDIEISYAGAEFDLVFLLGVNDLEDLQQLYYGYEELYGNGTVVTINTYQPDFGNLHLDYSRQSGMSEAMFEILQGMGVAITSDMATELLKGIEIASEDFTSLTATAETFETVAQLMRLGARRVKKLPKEETEQEDRTRGVEQLKQVIERKEIEVKKANKHLSQKNNKKKRSQAKKSK